MKLFIPDIGFKLTLTRPWTFWLYPERRNATLMLAAKLTAHFTVSPAKGFDGPARHPPEIIEQQEKARAGLEMLLRANGTGGCWHHLVKWKGQPVNQHNGAHRFSQIGDLALCEKFSLPKGAVLTVDRIYIRKGKGMSNYSSVSFLLDKKSVRALSAAPDVKMPGGKGKLRFWAKLDDVNSMEVLNSYERE